MGVTVIDESWYVRPPGAKDRTSAGGVVVRRDADGQVLVALAREQGSPLIVLPKGGVEKGEALETAARREIAEESGFTDLTLLGLLGTRERLDYNRKRWITTHYFLYATTQVTAQPTDPNHAYESVWLPLDGDLSDLFWPEQRALLTEIRDAVKQKLEDYHMNVTVPPTPERVRNYRLLGLDGTPAVLGRLLEGITEEELDQRPDPERFTLREALAHVADWEGVWLERMRRIVAEEDPFLPGYDEGQWAIDHDYAHARWQEQFAKFQAGRAEMVAFLKAQPTEAYARTARHGELGPLTLNDLATLVLAHDAYHLRQFVDFR